LVDAGLDGSTQKLAKPNTTDMMPDIKKSLRQAY
jgi:hypothetical protein